MPAWHTSACILGANRNLCMRDQSSIAAIATTSTGRRHTLSCAISPSLQFHPESQIKSWRPEIDLTDSPANSFDPSVTMSSGAICAICYEDARPICEDLQSISACGHVFHELCLQQWMEYCPQERNPFCPLCKQSCTARDVHRLYFQSAENDSTQPQVSPSEDLQIAVEDPEQVNNAPALRKLNNQLAAAKTALQSRNEQLKELDTQVAVNLQRAEKAEATTVIARRELAQCRQGLTRVQEELKFCSIERDMLQEKNQAMAKDLAAHKLVGDADLGEEDILRLANLGFGSDKNAIIETLTKSLLLRNKSYKELMARCNELGMSESRAFRKCVKAVEHSKKVKARNQELENLLESKDNACLRGLDRGYLKSQGEDVPSAQERFTQSGALGIYEPGIPSCDQSAGTCTQSRGRNITSTEGKLQHYTFKPAGFGQDFDVMPRAELSEVQLPNIVKERGLLGAAHVQPNCSKNVTTSEEIYSSRKRVIAEGGANLDFREDNIILSTGFSHWVSKSRQLLQTIEMLNKIELSLDRMEASMKSPNMTAGSVAETSFPRPALPTRLIENRSSAVASSSTCKVQPILNPPRMVHELETESCSQNLEPAHSFAVSPVNRYGAFAKKALSDRKSASNSTFIVSGADGRGGKVTVFKPPSLPLSLYDAGKNGSASFSENEETEDIWRWFQRQAGFASNGALLRARKIMKTFLDSTIKAMFCQQHKLLHGPPMAMAFSYGYSVRNDESSRVN